MESNVPSIGAEYSMILISIAYFNNLYQHDQGQGLVLGKLTLGTLDLFQEI